MRCQLRGPRLSLCVSNSTLNIGIGFVSEDGYNQVPEAEWLKTMEICFLPVLEAGNQSCRCRQGRTPSEILEEPSLRLPASSGGHPALAFLGSQLPRSVSLWLPSSAQLPSACEPISHTGLTALSPPLWPHFNSCLDCTCKDSSPHQVAFTGARG